MKIDGFKTVVEMYKSTYRQPYPVASSIVTVDGKEADLVIPIAETRLILNGISYSGEILICLAKDKV